MIGRALVVRLCIRVVVPVLQRVSARILHRAQLLAENGQTGDADLLLEISGALNETTAEVMHLDRQTPPGAEVKL